MADDLSGFSMLELFRLEAESQTAVLSAGVLAIEELERSPQTVESMMRAAHSLKGAARIVVAIEPFQDEVSVANNRVEHSIRVVNEKVNVLYIEGNNRWEFRYLSAILKRDPRLKTTFIASSAGPEFARNSP